MKTVALYIDGDTIIGKAGIKPKPCKFGYWGNPSFEGWLTRLCRLTCLPCSRSFCPYPSGKEVSA